MIGIILFFSYVFFGFLTTFFVHLFYERDGNDFYHNDEHCFDKNELIVLCVVWPPFWFYFIITFIYSSLGNLGVLLRLKINKKETTKEIL